MSNEIARNYKTINPEEFDIDPQLGIYVHRSAKIGDCFLEPGVFIEEGVEVGDDVLIGRNVRLKKGVVIGNGSQIFGRTTIFPDTFIGRWCTILEGCHLGRPPEIASGITRTLKAEYPGLKVGDGCLIGPYSRIYRGVILGKHCSVYEFTSIREQCVLGDDVVVSPGVTIYYETQIGDRTRIHAGTHLTGNMDVGNDVFISFGVGSSNDSMLRRKTGKERWRGPIIENGAVVGGGAMLAPGVVIGEGSFVCMQALVTKDVNPGTIVMGVPAVPKLSKRLFNGKDEK